MLRAQLQVLLREEPGDQAHQPRPQRVGRHHLGKRPQWGNTNAVYRIKRAVQSRLQTSVVLRHHKRRTVIGDHQRCGLRQPLHHGQRLGPGQRLVRLQIEVVSNPARSQSLGKVPHTVQDETMMAPAGMWIVGAQSLVHHHRQPELVGPGNRKVQSWMPLGSTGDLGKVQDVTALRARPTVS